MTSIFLPPVGVFRTIFFYVGQGDSTLLIIPDGEKHKYVLLDANQDSDKKAINVAKALSGNIPEGELIFINSHPHKDHLDGLADIDKEVSIGEVWNSGHEPYRDDDEGREHYDNMLAVIDRIGADKEFFLRGSDSVNIVHTDREDVSKITRKIGDVDYQVLAPASYVCDDIADEDLISYNSRIHEQCAVIRWSYGGKSIILASDAELKAWRDHIVPHFGEKLKSDVLAGLHHGSYSVLMESSDDPEPYEKHIELIGPEYIVLSAPKDSPHGHPHKEAMDIYQKHVDSEKIHYLGSKEQSTMIDIDSSGNMTVSWIDIPTGKDEEEEEEKEIKNTTWSEKTYKPVSGGAYYSKNIGL